MALIRDSKIKVTTPEGTAVYPHLAETDSFQMKNYGKLEYNTKLKFTESEAAEFVAKIDAACEAVHKEYVDEMLATTGEGAGKIKAAAKALNVYKPYDIVFDDDTGEPTGEVLFKAKCSAGGTTKAGKDWTRELPIYDSTGAPIPVNARGNLKLWGGSRIKLSVELIPFNSAALNGAGYSLRIQAVQVISTPQAGAEASADSFGFGVVEGGFVQDSFQASPESAPADVDEDDDF